MSNDWIEHNGGPQPVGDDVWLCLDGDPIGDGWTCAWLATQLRWLEIDRYRILNQHLIDAALKRGIELGLGAAHKAIVALDDVVDEAERSVLEDASMAVCAIDPETIAKEAQHD